MSPRALPLALLAIAGLSGCGFSVAYSGLRSPPHPVSPVPAEQVEVFLQAPPERPFSEIGVLEAHQRSPYSRPTMPEAVAVLREEAARQGCDGIVILGTTETKMDQGYLSGSFAKGRGSLSGFEFATTLRDYRATCVVFTDAK